MRNQLMMSPSWPKQRLQLEKTCAHLDEHLITVLDRAGARFALRKDAGLFHQVSEKFFCTSELLDLCVAAILHPTATSTRNILGYIADHMGDTSFMLPAATGVVLLTLLEHILRTMNVSRSHVKKARMTGVIRQGATWRWLY